ncbi:MAG: phosphoribosylaminoimidazole carboxylase [Salinibacter sp.]|uniref:phosphoribosylaminoimidazole carboxylase n=1 Tax=Salinibacter sp. TaxID=2065818 RepID=UPI0035D4873E
MSSPPSVRSTTSVLHPASGLLILGADWLLFSGSTLTLGLSTPALAALGFGIGGLGAGAIQKVYHDDGVGLSVLKGLLAGLTVGIPLPVAGTAVGGTILALSGLDNLWGRDRSDTEEISSSASDGTD